MNYQSTSLYKADCSITLVKGPHNVIVDPGNAWDKEFVLNALQQHCLTPSDIDYLVATHGHGDHVGNLNLFTKATHIIGTEINKEDAYTFHHFKRGIPYEIDDNHLEVISTPGHTGIDVSVVVRGTDQGTVVIAGDLFERAEDLDNPVLWQEGSENPRLQEQSRIDVLEIADYIVPGHGPMFKVPEDYKHGIQVVMNPQSDDDAA
ncbi:metallo-beta-lactamase domain-containing protein 1-like [Lingula anatina]|uniref:Metallo-beta-lactamase domain-containing protein 1 n=1 Tax=Lingula anatina TaxID=7574 RepID=A0A1S3HCH9_LINAN|nr:metallo-beta-lactamase domain-containing protein 1-like [Lingula anatina]|eukprot:XP_013382854.1 metallo-beta-lactamase domain-containing protein 1-like [Lingula anatina]